MRKNNGKYKIEKKVHYNNLVGLTIVYFLLMQQHYLFTKKTIVKKLFTILHYKKKKNCVEVSSTIII